jgi:hypothetical protein
VGQSIKDNGLKMLERDMEELIFLMELFMKENGKIIK